MTPEQIAKLIGIPLDQWPGNCYAVACQMLNQRICRGTPRYGLWTGPVDQKCRIVRWRTSRVCRHGWIEQKNRVVDPTRWVFEAKEPYVYRGPADHYDVGAQTLRREKLTPCPPYRPGDQRPHLLVWMVSPEAHRWMTEELFQRAPGITMPMVFWMANLPVDLLGLHAEPIYRALIRAGLKALIPKDLLELVLPEYRVRRPR